MGLAEAGLVRSGVSLNLASVAGLAAGRLVRNWSVMATFSLKVAWEACRLTEGGRWRSRQNVSGNAGTCQWSRRNDVSGPYRSPGR
jgi:hypothetical protein